MHAPIEIKQLARSITSGSLAAFSKTLVPSARVAAIIKFSVPVTVEVSKNICAPFSRPFGTLARIYPPVKSNFAPILSRPFMCKLTGLEPIAQPPGKETSASPKRANRGPNTKIEARMVRTSSYGARNTSSWLASTSIASFSSTCIEAPRHWSNFKVVVISRRWGTFLICRGVVANKEAIRAGRAAFLAPEIRISPSRDRPPRTISLSIY